MTVVCSSNQTPRYLKNNNNKQICRIVGVVGTTTAYVHTYIRIRTTQLTRLAINLLYTHLNIKQVIMDIYICV